jgi:hypothetical protein
VRNQVAASLVDQLYANIDVTAALQQRLPPEQKGLAGPAAAGLREFSERAATRMLERPRVQALWVTTVTQAHRQLIRVLEDDTGPISTENGAVVLDLRPLVIQLGERVAIVGNVAERLGPDVGRVEVMQADQLETAQDLTKILKFLGMWLWLVPLILWAAALWIARDNRACDSAVGSRLGRSSPGCSCWWFDASAGRTSSTASCRRPPCNRRPTTPGTS